MWRISAKAIILVLNWKINSAGFRLRDKSISRTKALVPSVKSTVPLLKEKDKIRGEKTKFVCYLSPILGFIPESIKMI